MDNEEFIMHVLVRLEKIDVNLDEHIRRTELAEARLDMHERAMKDIAGSLYMAKGALALFGFMSTLAGLTYTIMRVIA